MTTDVLPATGRPPAAPPRLPPAPRWWADAVGLGAGLSLLVVLALWVGNRGGQQLLDGGPGAVSAIGRLTGLLAADLLLLQVLLMARVPLVERAFGQDRLARWHRWTGFTSFNLMVAHIVLITIGYAASADANAFGQLWDLVVSYPGMLLATAGTVAAGHGRGHVGAGGPAAAAVRVVAPAAPVRLPRRGAGAAAPAVDRHGLPRLPGRPGLLVDAYALAAGAVLVYRIGAAGLAQLAAPPDRQPCRGRRVRA